MKQLSNRNILVPVTEIFDGHFDLVFILLAMAY